MAYFEFLSGFIGVPALIFALVNGSLRRKGKMLPNSLRAWPVLPVVAGHVVLALLYTTPWDNYLVATRVWWYDPLLVSGFLIGYVPIEEYLFFIGQTLVVGMVLLLAVRLAPEFPPFRSRPSLRLWATAISISVWAFGVFLLAADYVAGAYLGLELAWAMIPITIQMAFGADILWHYRRPVIWTLVPASIFLSLADAIAIRSGTWTIGPEQSLGIHIGGILPVEEFVFFVLTTALVVFGMTLMLSRPSHERASWLPVKLRSQA